MAIRDNLVSHWKLEEAATANRVDSEGSNDLTDSANVEQVTGKIGNASDFESTEGDYLSRASYTMPTGNGARTITVWVNIESSTGDNQVIIDWGTRATRQEWGLILDTDLHMFIGIFGEDSADSDTVIGTGSFHFLAVTYDGTTVKYYLDGVADGTDTFAGTPNTTSTDILSIGILQTAANFEFDGIIDEVSVWSRELTSTEVSFLYNSGNGREFPWTVAAGNSQMMAANF